MSGPLGTMPGRLVVGTVLLVGALAVMRPWTVRPLEEASPRRFDGVEYVNSIWDAKVLPTAMGSARELGAVIADGLPASRPQSPAPRNGFVKGSGVVVRVDLQSRVGLALVRPSTTTTTREVAIQIGPVIRGTALRDALEFVRFSDFVNQLEFASVANALNDRVLQSVLSGITPGTLTGKTVAFTGALTAFTPNTPLEIVPVVFAVESAP